MADLDQVVSDDVEPSGSTDDVAASPAGGGADVSAEPEPAVGDYSPDWLNEPAGGASQPGYSAEDVEAYRRYLASQQYQAQYQQPPPQQPQNTQEAYLNSLVKDTRGTIAQIAAEQAQVIAGQLMAQQFGPYAQQMNQFIQSQARTKTVQADRTINDMYQGVFNKDEQFVGSPAVRETVKTTLQGLRAQALQRASYGDYSMLEMFNEPGFAEVALYAAKMATGKKSGGGVPASVPHVERSTPAAKRQSVELDPDLEEALSRFGPGYKERYLKELENNKKHQDFS